jgi:death-on-curing protein
VGIVQTAALYTAGIVKNRPFADGNKRAGFMAGAMFLQLNGFDLLASEEDVINAVLALAAGDLDEDGYAKWLRSNAKRRKK